MTKKALKLVVLFSLLLIILIFALKYHSLIQDKISTDTIVEVVEAFGDYGEVVYLLLISLRPVLLIPSPAVFIIGGLIFGTVKGSIFNLTGILINAALCYMLAYRFKTVFYRIVGEKYLNRFKSIGRNEEVKTLFTMRVTPAFPFDPVSYASGLVGIPLKRFFLGTILGSTPKVILYTYLGDGIENILSLRTLTVLIFLLGLAIAPYILNGPIKKAPIL